MNCIAEISNNAIELKPLNKAILKNTHSKFETTETTAFRFA